MKPAPFEYHAPQTLEEALALLAEFGDEAKVLAGGQSLVPVLALRLSRFEHLVDLNRIAALRYVTAADGVTRVGAMTTQAAIASSPDVRTRVRLLADATARIGHFQIRNRGTIGGSVCHADPAAEYPAVAVTLDAELDLASVRGTRTVGATEFFTGPLMTVAEPDEVVTEIRFGSVVSGWHPHGSAIVEMARRHGDFALAGAACAVEVDPAGRVRSLRLGLFGVASVPVRARAAEQAAHGAAAADLDPVAVGRAAVADISFTADVHADAAYRERVAAHLAGQAVRQALAEARSAGAAVGAEGAAVGAEGAEGAEGAAVGAGGAGGAAVGAGGAV
jgi:carbon-monoxide dehydrogenase medium subunit